MKFKAQFKEIDGEKWFKFDNEFERIRYYHGNVIVICLAICMLISMVILFSYIFNHVEEIKKNPFVYGLSKLDVEAICTCTPLDPSFAPFWVNSTNWGIEKTHLNTNPMYQKFDQDLLKNITVRQEE